MRVKPKHIMDHLIRTSKVGDKYGLKPGGLSIAKLQERPDGFLIKDSLPTGIMSETLMTEDKKVDLLPQEMASEIKRLRQDDFYAQSAYPLRMIGMREKLTHNTWMHNSKTLTGRSKQHLARIHPDDARTHDIEDGDEIVIHSAHGALRSKASLTDAMNPGNIALPHGWGQQGGWQTANKLNGANSNLIASDNPADTEKIAAMSVLNGIPVRVEKSPSHRV